ncbi:MAG TPA: AraC family transcriptional regulator [Xanthobacteraceae bacterium]|nr:AraC family transcriptional regulator [Xanthobacteraceae bacterium]
MLRLAANEAPECARADLLREFFHRFGVRYDVTATGREPIAIDLTLRRLPGLQISSGALQGARYLRTRETTDPTEDVGLVVNPRGSMLLRQSGREIELGEGDATLVSFTETLDTSHRAPGDMLVLRFPRPQLAQRIADARERELRRIPHGTPALSLLRDYVSLIKQEQASDDLQQCIVSHFYDLAAVAIGATRDAAEQAQGCGLRAARLHAIKRDVAQNLGQPGLSVTALALRHGCTPRLIQRLFEGEGTSFTDYVLTQRLICAHRLLTDPHHAAEKISTIAFDAGFGDVSYFNRVFRERYGDTPSAIRVLARAGRS